MVGREAALSGTPWAASGAHEQTKTPAAATALVGNDGAMEISNASGGRGCGTQPKARIYLQTSLRQGLWIYMDTLGVAEAASLLHLNPKRVQFLARTGRLPAVRVGRKWLFPRGRLEALLGPGLAPEVHPIDLSARNQLRGSVLSVVADGLMAEVRV